MSSPLSFFFFLDLCLWPSAEYAEAEGQGRTGYAPHPSRSPLAHPRASPTELSSKLSRQESWPLNPQKQPSLVRTERGSSTLSHPPGFNISQNVSRAGMLTSSRCLAPLRITCSLTSQPRSHRGRMLQPSPRTPGMKYLAACNTRNSLHDSRGQKTRTMNEIVSALQPLGTPPPVSTGAASASCYSLACGGLLLLYKALLTSCPCSLPF